MAGSFDDPRDAKALALLHDVIACLVNKPERITIEVKIRDGKVYLGVVAESKDVAFLIGKQGRMADAIRELMKAIGKQSRRTYVVYFEPLALSESPSELSNDLAKPDTFC